MATVTYIPNKTQSKGAMGGVIRYCSREDKTKYQREGREYQLISGKDCCGETAYREFMATKQQHGKAHGTFFYQYVQSFSPKEKITPQTAHEIGCKFAAYFKGHEVLIATHTDTAHIHSHLIINSVNHENGKKLQMARGSIHKLRQFSDDICREYGLSIVQPKEQESKNIHAREYRAADKGNSWNFKLMGAVDAAMAQSRTKAEFIGNMRKMGYGVNWSDNRKHITYTTPDGNKCRDNKLHDDKYLKENMEGYYEHRAIKGFEQAGKSDRGLQYKDTDVRDSAGCIDAVVDHAVGDRAGAGADVGGYSEATNVGKSEKRVVPANAEVRPEPNREARGVNEKNIAGNSAVIRGADTGGQEFGREQIGGYGETATGKGFDPDEATVEMDGLGSVGVDSIIRIAHHIENIVNPYNPEKERKKRRQEHEQRKQAQKQRQKSHDWGMEM